MMPAEPSADVPSSSVTLRHVAATVGGKTFFLRAERWLDSVYGEEQAAIDAQLVQFASDEFFAAKERLSDPNEPVFVHGKYDDHGKWMDGWESRRKREAESSI